jgi:hypothetical protein
MMPRYQLLKVFSIVLRFIRVRFSDSIDRRGPGQLAVAGAMPSTGARVCNFTESVSGRPGPAAIGPLHPATVGFQPVGRMADGNAQTWTAAAAASESESVSDSLAVNWRY